MADKINPRFKYPFQWAANGSVATIEEGEDDDLLQCVFAVLATKVGQRMDVPNFGIRSLVLEENGPSLQVIEAAIQEWEPRAHGVLNEEQLEDIKSKLVNVGIKGR